MSYDFSILDELNIDHEVLRGGGFGLVRTVTQVEPGVQNAVSFAESEKFLRQVAEKEGISSVFVTRDIGRFALDEFSGGVCAVAEPRAVFYKVHNYIVNADDGQNRSAPQIDATADIHPSATLPDHDLKIGRNVRIHANVVIYPKTYIGDGVIIRENSVIGTPAYYYLQDGGMHVPVQSAGSVVIGDAVELHSLVSIERGVFGGATVIGPNVKIDNGCSVGHDAQIGAGTLMAGSSLMGAFVKCGKGVFVGVGVTVVPETTIGDGAFLCAGSLVAKEVMSGTKVFGVPARRVE
ncbi:MAG: hypothetical protein LBG50_04615 [Clostridiales Family XIII bacterium]|jgi:UDP-3-O-[3-hydroxymyristoyl] glucosamine N-acyltransferase|nr:hypothetical protein [Clostridiales Family XIII bacterium]